MGLRAKRPSCSLLGIRSHGAVRRNERMLFCCTHSMRCAMTGPASELRNKGNKKKKTRRHEPAEYYCAHSMSLIALKLKLVHLHGYSSAFLHTRTRTAFPSACTLVPVGHTVRPGLVWFNTYLPVYLSTPYTIYSPSAISSSSSSSLSTPSCPHRRTKRLFMFQGEHTTLSVSRHALRPTKGEIQISRDKAYS